MSDQQNLELSGAASALKYLEARERKLRQQLDEAEDRVASLLAARETPPPSLDGADFDALIAKAKGERKDTEDSYYKAQKALLDYDKNVDQGRRDTSEKMTRREVEDYLFAFAVIIRGGVEQAALRQAQEAMEVRTPEAMYMLAAPMLRECMDSALKTAVQEKQLPPWFYDAINNAI